MLTDNKAVLLRPTTAAIRGNEVWFAIGQLGSLFGDDKPQLPFQARSIPLEGGALGPAVQLPGKRYYPEGITAADDGTLYIGSIAEGVVHRIPAGSTTAELFVPTSITHRGVLGLTVDEKRGLLWLCDSDPKLPEEEKGGELVGVSLSTAEEVARHVLPKGEATKAPFCNDVVVGPDESLWITDSSLGRVLRVPAASALKSTPAEPWLTGGLVGGPPTGGSGANGLEFVDGTLIVSNVGRGTLTAADPSSPEPNRGARNIRLLSPDGTDTLLCSPDGLALLPNSKNEIVVVENGGCAAKAPRIAVVTINHH
ncbi:MAG: hypothetical protein KTR25_19265 [Myxococcales bacterium]|nr:hypothetical protein [Myxococcales bacterium]